MIWPFVFTSRLMFQWFASHWNVFGCFSFLLWVILEMMGVFPSFCLYLMSVALLLGIFRGPLYTGVFAIVTGHTVLCYVGACHCYGVFYLHFNFWSALNHDWLPGMYLHKWVQYGLFVFFLSLLVSSAILDNSSFGAHLHFSMTATCPFLAHSTVRIFHFFSGNCVASFKLTGLEGRGTRVGISINPTCKDLLFKLCDSLRPWLHFGCASIKSLTLADPFPFSMVRLL